MMIKLKSKHHNSILTLTNLKPHIRGVFCLWDDGYIWGELKGDKKMESKMLIEKLNYFKVEYLEKLDGEIHMGGMFDDAMSLLKSMNTFIDKVLKDLTNSNDIDDEILKKVKDIKVEYVEFMIDEVNTEGHQDAALGILEDTCEFVDSLIKQISEQ